MFFFSRHGLSRQAYIAQVVVLLFINREKLEWTDEKNISLIVEYRQQRNQ